ncbi:MAG TPA: DUF2975 domain-containing protein [Phenylobacterium sp.]|nr:DUF2975 domain-containing protein [Phenylobacterium sp.]
MSETASTALSLSRFLLRLGVFLNLAAGAILIALLAFSFIAAGPVEQHITASGRPGADGARLLPILRTWVVLALPAVAAAHVMLTRALQILRAVREGRAFVAENAARLRVIAWCLLVIQVLHIGYGVIAHLATANRLPMDWSLSLTGWLGVLLLFVMASVFDEGVRMRTDLEAMI